MDIIFKKYGRQHNIFNSQKLTCDAYISFGLLFSQTSMFNALMRYLWFIYSAFYIYFFNYSYLQRSWSKQWYTQLVSLFFSNKTIIKN